MVHKREHRRCALRKRCFANHSKQLPPVPSCALSLDQTHPRRPGDMRVRGVHTPGARRHSVLVTCAHSRSQRTAYTNPVWYGTRTHRPMTRSQEPVLECDTAQLDSRQHHAHASCLWLASYNFKTPFSDQGLNLHRISNRASPLFNLVPSGPSAG